jgi:VWFA-related protein
VSPTRRFPIPILLFLAAATLAAGLSLRAQEDGGSAEEAPTEIFIDRVEVNLVNVEVYVTDKAGNRVDGLGKDNFEILEDGRPVTITNFYAVADGRPVADSVPAPDAAADDDDLLASAASVARLRGQPEIPEDQRLHLVIYFDNLFLKPFSRNNVARRVRQFLRTHLSPGDQVMLVTFERWTHVRHPFTTDRNAISEELYEIETLSGFAEQAEGERRRVLHQIEGAATIFDARPHVDLYAESLYHDVTLTITNLKELVSSLAGLPGRKAILHVSDGIPMTPGEDLYYLLDSRFSDDAFGALDARRYNVRNQFHELTARANANRVTFYTLEAAGLRSHTTLSAEYAGSRGTDGLVTGSRIDADIVRASSFQEPLQMMALETGGLATFSTNNFGGAFDRMADDFRSYYSLAYSPARSGDGRYHDIEVKVKGRKDLEVRHRTGYRDKSAETQLSEVTMAALLYGVESNPMDIELKFSSGVRDPDGNYLLPIEVKIPIGGATLIPQADVYYGKLLVSVAVIDDDGRMSTVQQTPVPLEIPSADIEIARQQSFVYEAQLLMRRGDQRVAVGVRDELAAQASYIRRSVRIGT